MALLIFEFMKIIFVFAAVIFVPGTSTAGARDAEYKRENALSDAENTSKDCFAIS